MLFFNGSGSNLQIERRLMAHSSGGPRRPGGPDGLGERGVLPGMPAAGENVLAVPTMRYNIAQTCSHRSSNSLYSSSAI